MSVMKHFIIRWMITTVAVLAASAVFPGIETRSFLSLLGASLLLGIANALVRPILLLLSFPLILASLGLFILVINAFLLWVVSKMAIGFEVQGAFTTFFGALFISVVSWIISAFFKDSHGRVHPITYHPSMKQARGRTLS